MKPRDIGLAVAVMAVWGFNFVVIETGLDHFPFFGVASAALFLGERVHPVDVAGGVLVVGGVLLGLTRLKTGPGRLVRVGA
ncbi:hypothetical protein [Actinoplanes sp. M2I2]|uniref:hypothetical protein n=1 Tax=Actinoplanes sp. M2I2 TaxID=1734444 RepID=UPI002022389D|nr:hypothetical protein [Actinoplanes sp. M2I2]